MAFENAIITKEDDEKYGLSKIYYKYNPPYKDFINKQKWTIDKSRDCWMWCLFNFPSDEYDHALSTETFWILYCDNRILEITMDYEIIIDKTQEKFHRIWKLLYIKPSHAQNLSRQDILLLLKEILEVYRDRDLIGKELNYTMEIEDLADKNEKRC